MNILIEKLNKRSSELLLTKILSMTATQIYDYNRLTKLADEMVKMGYYTEFDRCNFLTTNLIKIF